MRRTVPILAAVLVGQVTLAALLQFGGATTEPMSSGGPLVAFEADAIDSVRISTADGDGLRVERAEGGWRLPSVDGFPASGQRVERLLGQLDELDGRLPVARSESARERFRVGSDDYERRVELRSGDESRAIVFFGKSAGAGRVYARAKGQDMIHEVEFALWDAAADAAEWYDQAVAAVDPASVREARLPGFRLRRDGAGGNWRVADGGSAEDASADKASSLLERLARPSFESVARGTAPEGEPTLAYTLTTKDGKEIGFRYFSGGKEQQARLYRTDQPWQYTVADQQLARLSETGPEKLLADQSSSGASETAAKEAGAGSAS